MDKNQSNDITLEVIMPNQTLSQKLFNDHQNIFIIGISLMITVKIIQILYRKFIRGSDKKDNTALSIVFGLVNLTSFILVAYSLNFRGIYYLYTQPSAGSSKETGAYCFSDYFSNPYLFYTGSILLIIGLFLSSLFYLSNKSPGFNKFLRDVDFNNMWFKSLSTFFLPFGILLIILSLNIASSSAAAASKYFTWTSLFIGVAVLIIGSLVYGYCVVDKHRQKYKQNWAKYRCKPYVIPFASVVGPPGTSITDNMEHCVTTMGKDMFDVFMHPWVTLMDMFKTILKEITMDIQDLRKMVYYIRQTMIDAINQLANKAYDLFWRLSVLYNTIKQLLLSIFYVMRALLKVLDYAFSTVASIWNGKIGSVARFFCFDPETPIHLENGNILPIKDVKLGDKVIGGGKVLGLMKFSRCGMDMFNYRGTIVAGTHLVLEDGMWIRVEDSKYAKIINDYGERFIYCLHTENNRIVSNWTVFGDYFETGDLEINKKIQEIILTKLNKTPTTLDQPVKNNWGFSKNTFVRIMQEFIRDGVRVEGFIVMKRRSDMYRLVCGLDDREDIYCSGEQIVLHKDEWIMVRDHPNAVRTEDEPILYNACVEDGEFEFCGYRFIDFEQISGESVNNKIDLLVMNKLNGL